MSQILTNNQLLPSICVLTVFCILFLPGIKCDEDDQCFVSKSFIMENFTARCICYRNKVTCYLRSLPSFSNFWPLFHKVKQSLSTVHLEVDSYSEAYSFAYFPLKLFVGLSASVKELTLSSWRFQSIPPFTVPIDCSLKSFEIVSNENLTTIEPLAFTGLPMTLIRLSLTSNSLQTIEMEAFKGLTNLVELELTSNHIVALYDHVFSDLSSLTNLSLKSNKLITMRKETFSGLTKLLELELSYNQLKVINNDTFYHMENLRSLDLSHNQIDHLAEKAFDGLISVEFIDLSHNELRTLQQDVLKYAKNLVTIDLKSNHLGFLDHYFLAQLPKTFYLKGNVFSCDCSLLDFVDRLMVDNEKTTCIFSNFNKSVKTSDPKLLTFSEYIDHVLNNTKLYQQCKDEFEPDLIMEKRSNNLRDNGSSGRCNQPILVSLILTLMISLYNC